MNMIPVLSENNARIITGVVVLTDKQIVRFDQEEPENAPSPTHSLTLSNLEALTGEWDEHTEDGLQTTTSTSSSSIKKGTRVPSKSKTEGGASRKQKQTARKTPVVTEEEEEQEEGETPRKKAKQTKGK